MVMGVQRIYMYAQKTAALQKPDQNRAAVVMWGTMKNTEYKPMY